MSGNKNADSTSTTNDKLDKMWANAEIENSKQDNRNRSKIAFILTIAFVVIAIIIIIGAPIYNATIGKETPIDINGTLSSFGSLFGTALGFVLGYYFKDKNNK